MSLRYGEAWLSSGFALSEDLPLADIEHLPPGRLTADTPRAVGAVDDARPDRWGEKVIRFVDTPRRLSLMEYLYYAGDDRFGARQPAQQTRQIRGNGRDADADAGEEVQFLPEETRVRASRPFLADRHCPRLPAFAAAPSFNRRRLSISLRGRVSQPRLVVLPRSRTG